MNEPNTTNFVTGGSDKPLSKCCGSCYSFVRDTRYPTHGWCGILQMGQRLRSVNITGSCDKHGIFPDDSTTST